MGKQSRKPRPLFAQTNGFFQTCWKSEFVPKIIRALNLSSFGRPWKLWLKPGRRHPFHRRCPVCLEPISTNGADRRRLTLWPVCHHQYHLACLARSRARARPAACALCRAPWPEAEDAALSRACNDHGVNPFVDSDPEPPVGRPIGAPGPRLHPPAPAPLPPPPPAPWRQQGPPDGLILAGANSWLYVPLLHAAAGDLAPSAIEAWRSAPPASQWWEAARAHLAAAAPVSAAELHTSLRAHAATGAAAAAAAISAAASQLPRDARVHFGWACRAVANGAGYIPAAA